MPEIFMPLCWRSVLDVVGQSGNAWRMAITMFLTATSTLCA